MGGGGNIIDIDYGKRVDDKTILGIRSNIKIGIYFNMRFKDIFLTFIIILIFTIVFCIGFFAAGYKNIKKNWPAYACTPMIMPFASQFGHDTEENFTKCMGNMQSGIMDVFTAPLHFVTGTLLTSVDNLAKNIGDLRNLQHFMRGNIGNITGDIFGIIQNVLIQFQKMIIGMKSMVSQVLGVMGALMYMITGSMLVGASILNGPIITLIDILSLGMACFHPDTPIKLKNNKLVAIKNIHLGDILTNGSKVIGTLQLHGGKNNIYYKIFSKKLSQYIYVTEDHKILDSKENRFVPIRNYKDAIQTDDYDDTLYCLITDDHLIPIGEYTFWDWED